MISPIIGSGEYKKRIRHDPAWSFTFTCGKTDKGKISARST